MNAAVQSATMTRGDAYPHLPNAPIIEAVIDWRVKLPSAFDVSKFKEVGAFLKPKYELGHEARGFQFGLKQLRDSEPQSSSRYLGVQGYRFCSLDGLEIAMFGQDGFSFSRLKPYTRWESVFSEAERLWQIYRSTCEPEEISRIAVRYINRIGLPLPIIDLGEYLKAPPTIPPGVPAMMSFLSRAILHEPYSGVSTNLTQVIEGHSGEHGRLPFILDIDAYILKTMNPTAADLGSNFEFLREMKNRVFFATLTDKAIEMFR
jgi:uncharacterized protein (TIGR04255 family)